MNMDDIMQQALNITRAQAGVRPMSASEVAAYAAEIAKGIRTILESEPEEEDFESGENTAPACDPKRSIKENSIYALNAADHSACSPSVICARTALMPEPTRKNTDSRRIRLWPANRLSAYAERK